MKLAVIDSRTNSISSTHRVGSDVLPEGVYEQYVIDLDMLGPVVPAWIAVIEEKSGSVWPALGTLKLPDPVTFGPVLSHLQLWCKAGLVLATAKFGQALAQNRKEANARIKYWLEGGSIDIKGWVNNSLDSDDLPMRILQQWPHWKSEAFEKYIKDKNMTLWAARLETIKNGGYRLAVDENRLKVTYQRMDFRVSRELQKTKKR